MNNKYFVVKKGRMPGIYNNWDECKRQFDGYPGADHKSFTDISQAQAYLGRTINLKKDTHSNLYAYIGTTRQGDKLGVAIIFIDLSNSKKNTNCAVVNDPGSLKNAKWAHYFLGCFMAIEKARKEGYKCVVIYTDNPDIKLWLNPRYGNFTTISKKFKNYMRFMRSYLEVYFNQPENVVLMNEAKKLAEKAINDNINLIENPLLLLTEIDSKSR